MAFHVIPNRSAIVFLLITGNALAVCSLRACEPQIALAAGAAQGIPQVDALGDPLPRGAVARIGSQRAWIGEGSSRVIFSPDGKYITATSAFIRLSLRLWDANTGKVVRRLKELDPRRFATRVAFSNDSTMIASVDDWGTVWVGYTATGRKISALMGSERLDSLAFSPDGKSVHGHDARNGILWNWDVASGKVKRCMLLRHSAVALSPNGKYAAIGHRGGTMSVRDLTTWAEVRRFGTHGTATAPLAFSPDGKRLASSGRKRTIQVWDVATGRLEGRFPDLRVPDGLIIENLEHQVAFSPDGKTLAVAETLTALSLWDVATGRRFRRFHHLQAEHGFTFAPDGKTLVSGGTHFRFWDIARGHEIGRFPRLGEVASLAFRADGNVIATATGEELQLWEVSTARELRRMNGPLQSIHAVAFAPDGKVLASSGFGGTIQLWDAATGREIRRLPSLLGWVGQVAFSPDGKSFAAGDERGAHLWETATGREIPRFSQLQRGPIDAALLRTRRNDDRAQW